MRKPYQSPWSDEKLILLYCPGRGSNSRPPAHRSFEHGQGLGHGGGIWNHPRPFTWVFFHFCRITHNAYRFGLLRIWNGCTVQKTWTLTSQVHNKLLSHRRKWKYVYAQHIIQDRRTNIWVRDMTKCINIISIVRGIGWS